MLHPFSIPTHVSRSAHVQVHITFTPPTHGPFFADLELQYTGTGHTTYTALSGTGQNLSVHLSQDTVLLLPTYVTKMSQKTFKVSVSCLRFDFGSTHAFAKMHATPPYHCPLT